MFETKSRTWCGAAHLSAISRQIVLSVSIRHRRAGRRPWLGARWQRSHQRAQAPQPYDPRDGNHKRGVIRTEHCAGCRSDDWPHVYAWRCGGFQRQVVQRLLEARGGWRVSGHTVPCEILHCKTISAALSQSRALSLQRPAMQRCSNHCTDEGHTMLLSGRLCPPIRR